MTNAELLAKLDALGTDDEKKAFVDANEAALKAAIDELATEDAGDKKVVTDVEELEDDALENVAGGIYYGCKVCGTFFSRLDILAQHKWIYGHWFPSERRY